MCQYNAMFMFGTEETYSDITASLRSLLRKDTAFKWNKACQTSFQKLKQGLSNNRVMAHLVQDRPMELLVDRGPQGIASTLYQQNPDTGKWHTINHTSRSLKPTEQKYAAVEGESLAILHGVTSNRMYLYGQRFNVVTDHQPLVALYNNPRKQGPARVEHHRMKLQGYRFEVQYRRGENNPTDYNSKQPVGEQSAQARETDDTLFINAVINAHLCIVPHVHRALSGWPVKIDFEFPGIFQVFPGIFGKIPGMKFGMKKKHIEQIFHLVLLPNIFT